jgi:Peroxidase, family 2
MDHISKPSSPTVHDTHTWIPRRDGDSRSPCPALNTMANHGLLPRDGNGITLFSLTRSVRDTYHLTWPLALFLGLTGFVLLKIWWKVDLHDYAEHNRVEHDASLVHEDAPLGPKPTFAPTEPDTLLLNLFFKDSADGRVLTIADIARARVRREAIYKPGTVSFTYKALALGEISMAVAAFGAGEAIPLDHLRTWLEEERFPVGWVKPKKRVSLYQMIVLGLKIRKAMEALRQKVD